VSHWADHYLACPYKHGARGPDKYDCWGFVWAALKDHYQIELPPFGRLTSKDGVKLQHAHDVLYQRVRLCRPQDGAIAAVYHGVRFVHVGLAIEIDGRIWVQHTGSEHGPERVRLEEWLRRHITPRFYYVVD